MVNSLDLMNKVHGNQTYIWNFFFLWNCQWYCVYALILYSHWCRYQAGPEDNSKMCDGTDVPRLQVNEYVSDDVRDIGWRDSLAPKKTNYFNQRLNNQLIN